MHKKDKLEIFKLYIKHIWQIVFILTPLLLLHNWFGVSYEDLLSGTYGNQNANFNNIWFYLIHGRGNLAIACTLSVIFYYRVRVSNSKKSLNKGNIYYDMPYWWFWFYAKIMGYSKLNMKLIPIPTQTRLILNDVFKEYIIGNFPETKEAEISAIPHNNNAKNRKIVNLIISDTYPIELKQIPKNIRSNYTIMISRRNDGFKREYSKDLIFKINEEIRKLPANIDRVNCFMATNTMHVFHITNDVFKNGDRGNVKSLFVYSQERQPPRNFKEKGKRVYNR